jgi:hypothetical protein
MQDVESGDAVDIGRSDRRYEALTGPGLLRVWE